MKRGLLLGAVLLTGCALSNYAFDGRSGDSALEASSSDGAPDAGADSALDAGMDSALDASVDAAPDVQRIDASDASERSDPAGDAGPLANPRALAPLSASRVRSRRPTLRWTRTGTGRVQLKVVGPGPSGLLVMTVLDAEQFTVTGPAGSPLAPGVYFWTVSNEDGTASSPRWSFRVPAQPASGMSTDVASSFPGALDVNNDGAADALIGAPGAGLVELRLGGQPDFGGLVSAATNIIVGGGTAPVGFAVTSAGDLDGDGYGDLAVGACARSASGDLTGRPCADQVQMYFGGPSGLRTPIVPRMFGGASGTRFGASVAGIGDINGDGYGDLLVGAPNANAGVGVVHLFLGNATGVGSGLAFANPHTASQSTSFGYTVSAAGDVNGDGRDDAVIGSNGAAWLLLSNATGTPTLTILPLPHDPSTVNFGLIVAGGGDLNSDGLPELAVSSYVPLTSRNAVLLYRVAGGVAMVEAELARNMTSALPATSLSMRGDIDADGYADLLMGFGGTTGNTGTVQVAYGNPSTVVAAPRDMPTADVATVAPVGNSVAILGDCDNDGRDEWLVGSPGGAPMTMPMTLSGVVSLYPGQPSQGAAVSSANRWSGTAMGTRYGQSVGP